MKHSETLAAAPSQVQVAITQRAHGSQDLNSAQLQVAMAQRAHESQDLNSAQMLQQRKVEAARLEV